MYGTDFHIGYWSSTVHWNDIATSIYYLDELELATIYTKAIRSVSEVVPMLILPSFNINSTLHAHSLLLFNRCNHGNSAVPSLVHD